jgi:hypothetical protein
MARPSPADVTLAVLSNRADLVSGGEALVAVGLSNTIDPSTVRMQLGDRDVTKAFAVRPNGRYEGLLTGLAVGVNKLSARLPNGRGARLTITNHPNGGPVFSGPQVHPWVCQQGAVDDQCDQPPRYRYLYRSTSPLKAGLQSYNPAHPAADVAMTITDQGVRVPFIVQVETGYQDRDQYKILTLYQPGKPWQPWAPQQQWNHKLLITHGGGCDVDYSTGNAPLDDYSGTLPQMPGVVESYVVALGRGFAVLSTALDNNGHNCNLATQAESLMMAKERLIDSYGELRYTIGTGCSGGSLTQQQVADAYPGIYQGLLPTCSFPDTWSSATQVGDYHLLRAYFENSKKWGPGVNWFAAQWGPVEGNPLPLDAILSDNGFFAAVLPTHACGGITDRQRYQPQTNPGGVRCGIADYMINVLGPRPPGVWSANERKLGRGFAGLPIDNVGVQYGLESLQQGLITPAQFVDLNAKIGAVDIDINPTPNRGAADEPALAFAYRSGAINEATNLDQVAIIDGRGPDPGLAHDSYRAFAVRARLDRDHRTHANQVIWEGPTPIIGDAQFAVEGLVAMDRWLSRIERDQSSRPLSEKVIADRPTDITDRCSDGVGQQITTGLCPPGIVPVFGTPRTVAGDAITTDTNKCQLKPLRRSDYRVTFTNTQWAHLQTAFPTGVCDYTKPAVAQQPTIPWLTYQDGSGGVIYGGRPLPPPPRSVPVS